MPVPDRDPPSAPPDPRIEAAVRGDRQASAALLQEALPRVRNLVRYLVRGDSDTDDIAQEALIAVLRGLPTYRGEGSFKSWSDRVVVRTTLGLLKKSRRERAQKSIGADLMLVADSADHHESYASRRELIKQLDELSYDQRHALVLHHVLGMSVPEIAEHLTVPFETVRSRLRLGQTALRARMQGAVERS